MLKGTIVLTLLFCASIVCRAQLKPYAGVGIGIANTRIQCPDGNCDQTAVGFKVFGGINLKHFLSVELSAMDLGKSNGNGLIAGGTQFNATVHTRIIGATIGRTFIVIPRVSVKPAIGLSSSFASLGYQSYSEYNLTKTNFVYLASLSVNYLVSAYWDARLQGDFTQSKPDTKAGNATLISIAAVYKF
jgi:Outer membrane protein beta-barrel domain